MSATPTTEAYRKGQWQKALATEAGRFVLADIAFGSCGALRDSYVADSDLATYQAGRRAAGLAVLTDVRAFAPEAYLQMLAEYQAAGDRLDAERERRSTPTTEDSNGG